MEEKKDLSVADLLAADRDIVEVSFSLLRHVYQEIPNWENSPKVSLAQFWMGALLERWALALLSREEVEIDTPGNYSLVTDPVDKKEPVFRQNSSHF